MHPAYGAAGKPSVLSVKQCERGGEPGFISLAEVHLFILRKKAPCVERKMCCHPIWNNLSKRRELDSKRRALCLSQ